MTITTTLKAIRDKGPGEYMWKTLLTHLGKTKADDEPLSLRTTLDSNGLEDALWCFRALGPEHEAWVRLTLCDLVEQAIVYTDNPHLKETLNVARRYARGEASDVELEAARASAKSVRAVSKDFQVRLASRAAEGLAAEVTRVSAREAGSAAGDVWAGDTWDIWITARTERERILRAALANAEAA